MAATMMSPPPPPPLEPEPELGAEPPPLSPDAPQPASAATTRALHNTPTIGARPVIPGRFTFIALLQSQGPWPLSTLNSTPAHSNPSPLPRHRASRW